VTNQVAVSDVLDAVATHSIETKQVT